ncbi:cytochrome P450 [Cladochytrium replicatum]|nr:cytochrome P450 [Cladochytrium replicatum]
MGVLTLLLLVFLSTLIVVAWVLRRRASSPNDNAIKYEALMKRKDGHLDWNDLPKVDPWTFTVSKFIPENSKHHANARASLTTKLEQKMYKSYAPGIGFTLSGSAPEIARTGWDSRNFTKLPLAGGFFGRLSLFGYMTGNSVVLSEGDNWKYHRNIVRPALSRPFDPESFISVGRKLLSVLYAKADIPARSNNPPVPVDGFEICVDLTMDVMGSVIFSYDFDALPPVPSSLTSTTDSDPVFCSDSLYSHTRGKYVQQYNELISQLVNPFKVGLPLLCLLPTPKNIIAWRGAWSFRRLLKSLYMERLQAREIGNGDGKTLDLLDTIIEAEESGLTEEREPGVKEWGEDSRLCNMFVFFAAGHDTTSVALASVLYLLALHPEAQEKAREECFRVFGVPSCRRDCFMFPDKVDSERFEMSKFNSLVYINAVIKEAMRLYPSVTSTVYRVAQRDVPVSVRLDDGTYLHTVIPKGAAIEPDLYGMHYDPDSFSHPKMFVPERWIKTAEPTEYTADPNAWVPFGGGQRICLGMQFALIEQRIMISMLLRAFKITLMSNDVKYVGLGALRPENLQLRFIPRHG